MIELDGVVRRMLLCPPDLDPDHVEALLADAEIDAVVTDRPLHRCDTGAYLVVGAGLTERAAAGWKTERVTEWLMLTSGTSGLPKIVGHYCRGACAPPERDDLSYLLRHPPLRRPADLSARRDRRRIDGVVGAR
jgi:hypothetical protein